MRAEPRAATDAAPDFARTLAHHGLALHRALPTTLQVNVGKRGNQAGHDCHVDAGPKRTERMAPETVARALAVLAANPVLETLDVTGGAPEMHPQFRELVAGARALGRRVIDRCNLTVLLEPRQEDTAAFLAEHGVEIVASLPCYEALNVDRQRGRGVPAKSLEALARLNALGYGRSGGRLRLDLVYNPVGPTLPPDQATLEARYHHELESRHGIVFDQMLGLPLGAGARTIFALGGVRALAGASIATGPHCFGCTAGAGSSCGGALAPAT